MHYFGAHTISSGGIHMSVRRAARAGMRTLQLFTAMPQYYNEKVSVKPERVERFVKATDEAGIDRRRVMVHSAYVLNTASPEPDKAARAAAGLAKELARTSALGVFGCCFHPGSAGSSELAGALDRVAAAITHAVESVTGESRVLVENTAGAGKTVGRTAEEVAGILSRVPANLRSRTGYGLDTCHLLASGHDIARSQDDLRATLDRFAEATGEAPAFFHLNDSEGELGSNRDRHALLGDGRIGIEPFRWLLADPRAQDVPLILETPQAVAEVADDDDTPDAYDVRMIQLLERLVA